MNEEAMLSKEYPSIKYAYEIAMKSYDWCIDRSNAIDGEINKLLAWISGATIAVPTFIFTQHFRESFNPCWLGFSILSFLASIVLGMSTKIFGSLELLDPKKFDEIHLAKTELIFKKDILLWTGEVFERNQGLVNWKGKISMAMIICFFLEITAFGLSSIF